MYQSHVDYLNLEYIFLRAYDFVAGFHFTLASVPSWTVGALTTIAIVGMVLSLILLLLIVYTQIRLLQVEHAGFHALEAAHEPHEVKVESGQSERWRHIEELGLSPNHADWRRAILEADIMLSDALAEAGYTGPTVGDQLKMVNPLQVTNLRLAWDAHLLRNKIAHGGESFELGIRDVQTALNNFKRVFEELGVI